MKVELRKAIKEDLPIVLELIQELATYEKAPDEVTITLEDLEKDGFGESPIFEIILAENENGILGMSFYFFSYSTWKGRCLYLEDIIVKQEYRGHKIGSILFDATIKRAKEINAKRMQWQVLDWNEPAINFYKKYNSNFDDEWVNCKLTEEQIINYK